MAPQQGKERPETKPLASFQSSQESPPRWSAVSCHTSDVVLHAVVSASPVRHWGRHYPRPVLFTPELMLQHTKKTPPKVPCTLPPAFPRPPLQFPLITRPNHPCQRSVEADVVVHADQYRPVGVQLQLWAACGVRLSSPRPVVAVCARTNAASLLVHATSGHALVHVVKF